MLSALRSYQLPELPPDGTQAIPDGDGTRKVYYYESEPQKGTPEAEHYNTVDAQFQLADKILQMENPHLFRMHLVGVVLLLGALLSSAYMIHRCVKAAELTSIDKALAAIPLLPALLSYLVRRKYFSIKDEAIKEYRFRLERMLQADEKEKKYFSVDGIGKLRLIHASLSLLKLEPIERTS